jgi:hypothetical protein
MTTLRRRTEPAGALNAVWRGAWRPVRQAVADVPQNVSAARRITRTTRKTPGSFTGLTERWHSVKCKECGRESVRSRRAAQKQETGR